MGANAMPWQGQVRTKVEGWRVKREASRRQVEPDPPAPLHLAAPAEPERISRTEFLSGLAVSAFAVWALTSHSLLAIPLAAVGLAGMLAYLLRRGLL